MKPARNPLLCEEIKIKEKWIGACHPAYIIAEMACAHDGDLERAKALVDIAVEAGADAVQLQLFSANDIVIPTHPIFDLLKKIEFTPKQWKELWDYCRNFDIAVFACTYDLPSAELALNYGVDGIKLNSADLSNPELVGLVARSKVPFTLGTGASTLVEIAEAIGVAVSAGNTEIILMHGVQNFPTPVSEAHINRIKSLKAEFNSIVGYQDHTDASLDFSKMIDLLAIGAGVNVIEKHITLNRTEKGTDYEAALESDEFKEFVSNIRSASNALGNPHEDHAFSESDLNYRRFQKKSIVALRPLKIGDVLTREKVAFLRDDRPPGLAPSFFSNMEGLTICRDIDKHEQIRMDDLNDHIES